MEKQWWAALSIGGVIFTVLALIFNQREQAVYGALFALSCTNAYRIAVIEEDHEDYEDETNA